MCFVSFNSVSTLIIIMFNIVYPVFHVGFICKGSVWERERVWRLKALKTEVFSRVAYDLVSHEVMHVSCTWLECEESGQIETAVFRSVSRVKPSREIPVKYSILPDCHFWYTLSVLTLFIPTLPTDVKECFWEKTLAINLES